MNELTFCQPLLLSLRNRKEQDKLMNRDEGSYQLAHIYDKLFAMTTSNKQTIATKIATGSFYQHGMYCTYIKFLT